MSETISPICRNCQHFRVEPDAIIDPGSPAAFVLNSLRLDSGGSLPPQYGKCVAHGKFAPRPGVFSSQPCTAKDSEDEYLFKPK